MAVSFVQRRRRQIMALGALACLLAAIFVQGRIEGLKPGAAAHPLLYLPSGKYLKVAALGFDGLLADLLYLWSIQYYGNYDIKDRYTYLERIYDQVITELDPHYLDPYLVGALIMTAEARNPLLTKVHEVMTPDVLYVFEDQDVQDAAKMLGGEAWIRLVHARATTHAARHRDRREACRTPARSQPRCCARCPDPSRPRASSRTSGRERRAASPPARRRSSRFTGATIASRHTVGLPDTTFGKVLNQLDPRELQFGLKLQF